MFTLIDFSHLQSIAHNPRADHAPLPNTV
uniref:Uncharacterized protein n=1 Tax=Arundo donax TaxID=35708 RepID=A0A0A9CCW4_ARUDO